MKKICTFIIIIFSFGNTLYSQQQFAKLIGKVNDSETNQGIPYVSISITNSTRGTATNEIGDFFIFLREGDNSEKLKFSSIGYITKYLSINSIPDIQNIAVELEPDTKLLKEVVIAKQAINPVEIIEDAINSLDKNYLYQPFNLEFYSKLEAKNVVEKKSFVIESVLFGYCEGYEKSAMKNFNVLANRSEGENPLEEMNYPYWPSLEIHRADVISDPEKTGILNIKNLDKFEFKYNGIATFDTDTTYIIEYFAPKPSKKITGYERVTSFYKGVVYITTSTFAIIRHDIETDGFSHSIYYKKMGDYYFPYMITGSRGFDGDYLFTRIKNEIILTNLRLEDIQKIELGNEFRSIFEIPDDPEYWEINHPNLPNK